MRTITERSEHLPTRDSSPEAWIGWANSQPTIRSFGMTCVASQDDSVTFDVDLSSFPSNPNGSVNGGVLAAISDNAFGFMAFRSSSPTSFPATASLHIQFHKPAATPLRVKAKMLPGGRKVQYVEVVITDESGNRCATALGTMVVGAGAADRPEAEPT